MTAPKNNEKEGKPKMSDLPLDVLAKILCPVYFDDRPPVNTKAKGAMDGLSSNSRLFW